MEYIRKEESSFKQFIYYISSIGIAQTITKSCVAPLERLKLILQAQNVLTINDRAKFNSLASYFQRIPSEQGVKAFWRGNLANIVNIIPAAFAQYMFYDNIQRLIFANGDKNCTDNEFILKKLLCAISCGFTSMIFTYPLDTIRVRLSLEFSREKRDRLYQGIFQTIGEIKDREKLSGLYKGFFLANLTNIHQFISLYIFIDLIQNLFLKDTQNGSEELNQHLKFYGVANFGGFLAQMAIYPLDTIRRRLQMNGYNRNPLYQNSYDCYKQIFQKEGIKGFYKGMGVASMKYLIAMQIQISVINWMTNNNHIWFKKN